MNGLVSSLLVATAEAGHEAADTLSHAAGVAGHGAEAATKSPEFPNIIEILNHYFQSEIRNVHRSKLSRGESSKK